MYILKGATKRVSFFLYLQPVYYTISVRRTINLSGRSGKAELKIVSTTHAQFVVDWTPCARAGQLDQRHLSKAKKLIAAPLVVDVFQQSLVGGARGAFVFLSHRFFYLGCSPLCVFFYFKSQFLRVNSRPPKKILSY